MTHTASELAARFGVDPPPMLEARYNIAPSQPVLIVREDRHRDHARECTHVVWGLIPPWAEDTKVAFKMINARADTIAEKPAYKHAFKRRRCLLPASGFYEWRKIPQLAKAKSQDLFDVEDCADEMAAGAAQKFTREPNYIRMKSGELFAFAGLWEVWNGPNGETIESCMIITTSANELLAPVHDRMPVIVGPESYGMWLDTSTEDTGGAQTLLTSFRAEQMERYVVSSIVNSPKNDEPACSAPVERTGS